MGNKVSSGEQKYSGPLPLEGRPIRVGFAGAGPAGLCIAGILAREAPGRFQIEVFERDPRERDQGAGWDIDAKGRDTLRRAGLDPASISRPGETSFRCFKAFSSEPYIVMAPPAPLNRLVKGDPETNRYAMREGLLAALGSRATVTFNCGVGDVQPNGKGGATFLDFEGKVLGDYDIVIDSSGVASPLRKRRVPGTEIKEWYTGITTVGGIVRDPETELDPEVVRRLGQGTLSVLGDRFDGNGSMAMFLQRFGARQEDHRASLGLYVARPGMTDLCQELGVPHSNRATSDTDNADTVAKIKSWMKKEMGDKWDPMYKHCVDCMTDVNIRPLFMFDSNVLPVDSELPFICVGDALHALPPFTGSGGNLALEDAGELGTFLVHYALGKERRALLPGLREVEMKCFNRAAKIEKDWGRSTQKNIIRTFNSKNVCPSYSLAVMMKGEGWTVLKLIFYVIAVFYMWLHKLSDYGMKPRNSKAKAV